MQQVRCVQLSYAAIVHLAAHLGEATPEDFQHEYLVEREVKRVVIIVVSSDRGLAGGLNNNLFKLVSDSLNKWNEQGIEVDIATIGDKANACFARYGGNLVARANN